MPLLFNTMVTPPCAAAKKSHLDHPNSNTTAAAQTAAAYSRYGMLLHGAALLCDNLNPITSLPATFFVIITNEEERADYYRVSYLDLNGWIRRTHVTRIDFEPVTKFHSAYFTAANDTHPVNIRAAPNSSATLIGTIPDGGRAFLFGILSGEALIPTAGPNWYFVRFLPSNTDASQATVFGYVYHAQGVADTIPPNIIERVPPQNGSGGGTNPDNDGRFDWLFIALLSIPAVVVVLALFSRTKSTGPSPQRMYNDEPT